MLKGGWGLAQKKEKKKENKRIAVAIEEHFMEGNKH